MSSSKSAIFTLLKNIRVQEGIKKPLQELQRYRVGI